MFDKTQTPKFALRRAQKGKSERPRPRSEFGLQLLEKQRARYYYGIGERQFKKYVREAIKTRGQTDLILYETLERRLDNVVYRLKFAPTRQAARQMVSHGHIMINGKKVNIPSFIVKAEDKVSIRPASMAKPLFRDLDEKIKGYMPPAWLSLNSEGKEAVVQGAPKLVRSELPFDLIPILEYYKR